MACDLRFDHAVIVVRDLDGAVHDYRGLGFTVVYGGQHTGGATHNALIVFPDGGYLELLAPTDPHLIDSLAALQQQDELEAALQKLPLTPRFARAIAAGEGLGLFALGTPALADAVRAMRARGLEVFDPQAGGRRRADGVDIRWQTAMPNLDYLPFLIQDDTPRSQRVPTTPEIVTHPNGASGAAEIAVLVYNLEEAIAAYRALLDLEPDYQPESGTAVFALDGFAISLMTPSEDDSHEHLRQRGTRPYLIRLKTDQPTAVGPLDLARTHQARIRFV